MHALGVERNLGHSAIVGQYDAPNKSYEYIVQVDTFWLYVRMCVESFLKNPYVQEQDVCWVTSILTLHFEIYRAKHQNLCLHTKSKWITPAIPDMAKLFRAIGLLWEHMRFQTYTKITYKCMLVDLWLHVLICLKSFH